MNITTLTLKELNKLKKAVVEQIVIAERKEKAVVFFKPKNDAGGHNFWGAWTETIKRTAAEAFCKQLQNDPVWKDFDFKVGN